MAIGDQFILNDAVKCAQEHVQRGRVCAGCHFDTRCGIYKMLREQQDIEREKYLESLEYQKQAI